MYYPRTNWFEKLIAKAKEENIISSRTALKKLIRKFNKTGDPNFKRQMNRHKRKIPNSAILSINIMLLVHPHLTAKQLKAKLKLRASPKQKIIQKIMGYIGWERC